MSEIQQFLACQTPDVWLERALTQQDILLIDHAHCEKKAASTAISLIYRYPEHDILIHKLSRLAREELRHFEKVLALLKTRNISFRHLVPSRYAQGLYKYARTHEPAKLIDTLIIGAFIEARSCERFERLAPLLEPTLQTFYNSLVKAESRHFLDYLMLAKRYADQDITDRIEIFRKAEADLIESLDEQFRFHSGIPA